MRITSIDIGTNTALLLIADVYANGKIETLRDEIAFPRLGKGIAESGLISAESAERLIDALKEYKELSETLGSERVIACGTSALRDSRNRDEVIQQIQRMVSIDVEVLSGDEEAHWTFLGAISEFGDGDKRFAVIDIGGGSTEVTLGTKKVLDKRVSLDLGCVRLTERFLRSAPPSHEDLQRATSHGGTALAKLGAIGSNEYELIGVAGTVTTLAAMDKHLTRFDNDRVNGHVLSLERIKGIFEEMRNQTLDQILASPLIPPGRADVILAGALILVEFMSLYRFDRITVSTRGLRYGLILRELDRSKIRVVPK